MDNPRRRARLLLPMAFLSAWAACRGAPPQNHGYFARPVVEKAAWKVFDGDRQVGWLRQLEIQDPSGPVPLYRVETMERAWVGHADADLRFTQRVPFRDQEVGVGIWPLAQGVGRLFELATTPRLEPVTATAPAAAPTGR